MVRLSRSNRDDSDQGSDYSVDFSSGDEALLCELADNISGATEPVPPVKVAAPEPAEPAVPADGVNALETDFTTYREVAGRAAARPAPSPGRATCDGGGGGVIAAVEPGSAAARARATAEDKGPVREFEAKIDWGARGVSDPAAATATAGLLPPLSRFRTFPRKTLTVTDLTAGAWCELQYFYTLTRLPGGRKVATPAMRAGARVHRALERQVHETVRVEIASPEDAVGVRIWNLIQGLRTLAEGGLTRELEVWGDVGGNVVSGVVDGLGWEDPGGGGELPLLLPAESAALAGPRQHRLVYVTDVKTRGSTAMPAPSSIWPAKIQLFLYHRFLVDMIADRLNYIRVFRRYGADPDEPFTDAFLAHVVQSMDESDMDSPSPSPAGAAAAHPPPPLLTPPPTEPTLAPALSATSPTPSSSLPPPPPSPPSPASPSPPPGLSYHTLRELLPLVRSALALAFPHGTASLASRLCVEYRHRADGALINRSTFEASPEMLTAYVDRDLEWWRGERTPSGVTVEDTFKCRSCEFAAVCEWRKELDEEKLRAVQEKLRLVQSGLRLVEGGGGPEA